MWFIVTLEIVLDAISAQLTEIIFYLTKDHIDLQQCAVVIKKNINALSIYCVFCANMWFIVTVEIVLDGSLA